MDVLYTAIQLDHLKFVYYWPEICLQVKWYLPLFLPHYCLQLVACMFQVRGIMFNKQIPKCLIKLSTGIYIQIMCFLFAHPQVPKNEAKHEIGLLIM